MVGPNFFGAPLAHCRGPYKPMQSEVMKKLIAILLVIIFPQYGYDKCQWDTDFKTLLSQNQIDYLRFLDHIQKNMYGSDTKIVWTVQAFHGCIDTSTR